MPACFVPRMQCLMTQNTRKQGVGYLNNSVMISEVKADLMPRISEAVFSAIWSMLGNFISHKSMERNLFNLGI